MEPCSSSCMHDHCYLNGIERVKSDEDAMEESSALELEGVVSGTVVQLQDGSIVVPNEDGLIHLEDGRVLKLENCNLVEVEPNDAAESEDESVENSNGVFNSEGNFAIPTGGCYIQLGDQLLYVENEVDNDEQTESVERIFVARDVEKGVEQREEMQWAFIKEEPEDVPQTRSFSSSSKTFSDNLLKLSGKLPSGEVVFLNLVETSASDSTVSSVKVEATSDDCQSGHEDEIEDAQEISAVLRSASLYSCKECNIQFDNRKDLLDHRKSHQKPFLCDICGQGFLTIALFKSHKASHESEESLFKCYICETDFPSLSMIKEHLKIHQKNAVKDLEKSYQCDLCDAKFIYRSNLCRHRKAHTKDKTHVCEVCGKGFYQKSNLQSHQQIHCIFVPEQNGSGIGRGGKTRRPKQFSCDLCGKGFANLTGLKNHDAMHTGHRPHLCPTPGCDKSFALLSCLKTHMATIHSEVKHLCQVCGKNYRNANYLKLHLKIHSGKKDFHCDVCSKAFIDNPSLRLHLRTHTGERPYCCKVCGKSFAQQAHLKTHVRTHTGEKPYDCSVCGKPFRQLSNKIEHERIHKKNV